MENKITLKLKEVFKTNVRKNFSKLELSDESGISYPTVLKYVDVLVEQNFIEEFSGALYKGRPSYKITQRGVLY
jgi:response regulator of citrate/malate metabolism